MVIMIYMGPKPIDAPRAYATRLYAFKLPLICTSVPIRVRKRDDLYS